MEGVESVLAKGDGNDMLLSLGGMSLIANSEDSVMLDTVGNLEDSSEVDSRVEGSVTETSLDCTID